MDIKKILKQKQFQNPVCQDCIKEHLKKYDDFVDEDKNIHKGFSVPCQGIPKDYLSSHMRSILSPEEQKKVIGLFDPVAWAEEWVKSPDGSPWVARWYQALLLRCTAKRRVTRLGRRTGKCLEEGTEIMTPRGSVEIQNLKPGDVVYAYDTKTDSVLEAPVVQVHDQGTQDVIDLERYNNHVVSCTAIHRWHISDSTRKHIKGVKRLEEFSRDTTITRRFVDTPGGNIEEPHAYEKTCDLDIIKTWNRESQLAYLAGLLDTDGCVQVIDGSLRIDWNMQAWDVMNSVKDLLLSLFQYRAKLQVDNRSKYKNGPVFCIVIKNNMFNKRILKQLDRYLVVERKKWKQEYSDLIENNENPLFMGVKFDLEKTRKAHCWDISIDTPDNLYLTAQGLVTHNTDAIAIHAAHYLITHKKKRVLIIAPYKSQVEEIITRLLGFLQSNPELASSIKRSRSSPFYQIEFYNGSELRGFSSGAKSGNDGVGIRGQDADRVYLDECFVAGTLVNTSEYALCPIEKLTLDDRVLGGNKNKVFTGDIQALNKKQAQVITLSTPINNVQLTPNHPLFNGEKDIPAEKAKEVIVSMSYRELNFNRKAILARLIGYNFGDGWIQKNRDVVGFSGQKNDLEQVIEDVHILGGPRHVANEKYVENKERGIRGKVSQFEDQYMFDVLQRYCPRGKKVNQPLKVPQFIKESGQLFIKANFLSGLFSAEGGHVSYQVNDRTPKTIDLRMCSSREDWISSWLREIIKLLADVGVLATGPCIKHYVDEYSGEERYRGTISVCNAKDNIDCFVEKIGFCYDVSKAISANMWKLYRWYESIYSLDSWKKNRLIRGSIRSAKQISKKFGIPLATVKYHKKLMDSLWSTKKKTPNEVFNYFMYENKGYAKLPIIKASRRNVGIKTVYNLTSGADHRFFGGGLFTHNCDYLTEGDLKAIIAILNTNANTELWASSTPSGRRAHFWRWCTKTPSYKEFYYPSSVLPFWEQVKDQIKADYVGNHDAWCHEIEALFGEQSQGVFQHQHVMNSLSEYHYDKLSRQVGWTYSIGVDWNSVAGTEIVTVGYDGIGKFKIVDAINIQKQGWTQLAGLEAVIAMNYKWRPRFLYVDDGGGGGTHTELLRKFGYESIGRDKNNPAVNLKDIVKAYNFSSKIEARDPLTKRPIKKHAKVFLVENAARFFEENRLMLSSWDTVLRNQLANYIIKNISINGIPLYGMIEERIGDHRLDALMLALVAFKLEMSEFGQPIYSTQVGITPGFSRNYRHTEGHGSQKEATDTRLRLVPQSRFEDDTQDIFQTSTQQLPGMVSARKESPVFKAGWDYDKEDEYEAKWRVKKMRNARRLRYMAPMRTNI